MIDATNYLATWDIAERSGKRQQRYRTADGRYILSNRDLAGIRLTGEEYVTGLRGIEPVGTEEARTLAARNGFKKGDER